MPELRRDLLSATNDTLRADALARLCFNLTDVHPDSARYFGEQALELATRIGHPKAIADAYNNLGWLHTRQGRYKEGGTHLTEALQRFRKLGDPAYTAVSLSNMGYWADQQGDRVGALKSYKEALQQSELARDTATTAILLTSIGSTYRRMNEAVRAREYMERALAMEQRLGRISNQGRCLQSIGNTWLVEGDTAKALTYYDLAQERYATAGDQRNVGMLEENRGDVLMVKKPARALVHYEQAQAWYDSLHSDLDQAYILHRIGFVQRKLKRTQEAARSYAEGVELARLAGATELVMEYELSLGELAVEQGRSDEAIAHFRRHMAMKDSLHGVGSERELMRVRAEFETEQAERENTLLKAENDLRRLNEDRLRNRWIAATAAALLLIALLLLLYRNYRLRGRHTREVERFNTELQQQRDQVQHMNDLLELKILRAQLNPHFIHNSQNSAIAMVREGRSVEALAYLQGLSKLMRMVLEHSVNDRITVEEEMAFLRLYVKLESLRMPGLQCEVEADRTLLDDEADLPALLVQPFVENALWHGLAPKEGDRSLTVRFTATEKGLRCTVRDNGVGRNGQPRIDGQRSMGTELTNERLQLLSHRLQQKGSFRITDLQDATGAPQGTEVVIELEG